MKVAADRDACVGAGNCVMVADTVFDQDDSGVVTVLTDEVPAGQEEHVRAAIRLCPAGALRETS